VQVFLYLGFRIYKEKNKGNFIFQLSFPHFLVLDLGAVEVFGHNECIEGFGWVLILRLEFRV
jgi:hypothetical protein